MFSKNEINVFDELSKLEDIEFFNILQNGKFSRSNINKDYLHSENGRTTFLCKACEIGSLDLVKWLLHRGADINRKDLEYGNTPLVWSVISTHGHVTKYLIKRGASVFQRNNLGHDVYYLCHGNQTLLAALLPYKRTSNDFLNKIPFKSLRGIVSYKTFRDTGLFGDTPVHKAIRRGNSSLLKRLIDDSHDVNTVNDFNETGLHIAVANRKLRIIKILIKKKANINVTDIDGNTPLHVAMEIYSSGLSENKLIVFLLTQNFDFSIKNMVGHTALHIAFQNKHSKLIKLILKHINKRWSLCFQMLLLAIQRSDNHIVDFMFRKLKRINNRTDEDGNSALHYAIINEKYDMVRIIVEHVNVNLQNNYGSTALHLAVEKKQNEIVGLLLSSKANVNLQNSRGETALHLSVSSNMLIFILLVDRCNISIKTHEGDTVLHRAAKYGESSYIPMIINSKSAETSAEEIALIDVQNKKGDTALHCACYTDNFDAVLKLLDFNGNQHIINESGQNCLDIARKELFHEIIKLLSEDVDHVEKSFGYDTCVVCEHVIHVSIYSYQCEHAHMYCPYCAKTAKECIVCGAESILRITNLQRRYSNRTVSVKLEEQKDFFEAMFVLY